MPKWSNAPPDDLAANPYRMVRTPASGRLLAIVTTADLVGCPTHFYNHRTVPCEETGCQPCNEGYPWRWHGWVTAFDPATREHFLFEFPAAAHETFAAYKAAHDTLRGAYFAATRAPQRANGRVLVRLKPADLEREHLPDPPMILAILAKIWGLPTPVVTSDDRLRGAAAIKVRSNGAASRLAAAHEQRS